MYATIVFGKLRGLAAHRKLFRQLPRWAAWLVVLWGLPHNCPGQTPNGANSQPLTITLGTTGMNLQVPLGWSRQVPRSQMLEHEFSAGDATAGEVRITIMAAGGSVDANVARWQQQFSPEDGQPVKNMAANPKRTIAGKTVHVVDFRGTYLDRPQGPLGPPESKENYRMLGAVVELNGGVSYFFKLYGPAQAAEQQQTAFDEFLTSMRAQR